MSTLTTCLRCIRRIDGQDNRPNRLGFVADKPLKLVERPSIQASPLPLSEFAVTDTLEVFHRDDAVRCEVCNAPADDVVHVGHKTPLSAGQPLQNTPDAARIRLCLSGLEGSVDFEMAVTDMVDMSTAEEKLSCAVSDDSDIPDTPVYTHNITGKSGVGYSTLEGDGNIYFALSNKEMGITKRPVVYVLGKFELTRERYVLHSTLRGPCIFTVWVPRP